jgi:hypothetical protein
MGNLDSIQALISSGRKDEAARQLARLLSASPENLDAWLLMADVIDDPARRADCYRQVLKIDPENPQALAQLGKPPTGTPPPPQSVTSPAPISTPSGEDFPPIEDVKVIKNTEPLAGQAPASEKSKGSVEDYLFANGEALALGKESVPAYLREIQAVPLAPPPPEPSRGSLFDAIDSKKNHAPPVTPPIPPGSYRDDTPPPPPPWYKKPAFRVILTLLILACFGAAIFGGARIMAANTPPTATLQPSLTVEFLPTRTPQDTWTPLPSLTPRPTLTPIPNQGSLRVALLQVNEISIWLAGASSPVTNGANLPMLLSPNGNLVIFTRVGDLWSVGMEDKKETQLMDVDSIYALQPGESPDPRVPLQLGWLPSSTDLLFSTGFNPVEGGPVRPANDLNKIDLATGKVTRLLQDGEGGVFYPSPDGSLIALSSPDSISLLESFGENPREVFAFDPILTPDLSAYYPSLVWTEDSSAVLLILPPRDAASDTVATTSIWHLPVDGSDPQRLSEVNTNGGPVVISPDQTRLLYQLNIDPESGAGELHAARIDGSGDTILQNAAPAFLVGWALNSRDYTFRTLQDNVILVGTLDQTSTVPLSTSEMRYDPAFSPEWINSSQYLIQTIDGVFLGYAGSPADSIAKGSPGTIFYDFALKPVTGQ